MRNFTKQLFIPLILTVAFSVQGAIPTGYYHFALGKKKAELKTTLHDISSPLTVLDYGSGPGCTWQGFFSTDRNADNTVQDMYSNIVRNFNGYNSIPDMAIEHSFPKSWWGAYENVAYKDLFHLYPADAYTNGIKNNLPLGEVAGTLLLDNGKSKIGKNGFGTVYTDNSFEPADEYKGDFARSYLYISTIYEDLAPLWNSPMLTKTVYPVWQPWAIDLLVKWHNQDPVSDKELARNDSIYAIQGNRNPFIDFPELTSYIWGIDSTKAFTYAEETRAFLVAPRRKTKLDFGVILLNVTKSLNLTVQGMNITGPVSFSFLRNSPALSLSVNSISADQAHAGYDLQVNYQPVNSGTTIDTLLIQGGGLTEITRIPVRGLATSEFIVTEPTDVTPVGGTLHWLEDPAATNYTVSLYQGDTRAGNLIISGYLEGTSYDKALEIYNGTGNDVDLSKYTLKKQSNGYGDYETSYKLSGTLRNNKTLILAHASSTNETLRSKATLFTDSVLNFNGDDAIALFRNGVMVDVIGKLNGGADYSWGFDKILKRNADVTHPAANFDLNQWTEYPYTQLDKIGTHVVNFASANNYIFKDKPVGITNHLTVDNLNPNENYTYSVTSYRSGVVAPSVNTQRLRTAGLEIPVGMAATDISGTSFTANWEETPYAAEYYLDVYQLSGEIKTETEGFNNVGTNGKTLPDGWTGTASGNYTTAASSGINIPSIAFKNNLEWLQTKQFTNIIRKISFMYRYPSAGTGSYFTVEGQNQSGWSLIETIPYNASTAKYYPSYTFSPEKGYTAIKFTYTKVTGNLALDDVTIEHGKVDTVFVEKNKPVTGHHTLVVGLNANTEYYYRLKASFGNSFSHFSDAVFVSTTSTGLTGISTLSHRIHATRDGIKVCDLNGGEIIRLYSITGSQVSVAKATSDTYTFPLEAKGIFVLKVESNGHSEIYKIVK